MELREALKLKKIQVRLGTGRMIPRNEFPGDRVRIRETIVREATPEDVLKFDEVEGVIITSDGRKHYLYR